MQPVVQLLLPLSFTSLVKVYTVIPLAPATRTVPAAPTGFASTVSPPVAADAAADAGASDAGATDAGAAVAAAGGDADAPLELQPTRRAAVMNSDPTIRAFDRMAQDLSAGWCVGAGASDSGDTSAWRAAVSLRIRPLLTRRCNEAPDRAWALGNGRPRTMAWTNSAP